MEKPGPWMIGTIRGDARGLTYRLSEYIVLCSEKCHRVWLTTTLLAIPDWIRKIRLATGEMKILSDKVSANTSYEQRGYAQEYEN
jgi:hypothetical protein